MNRRHGMMGPTAIRVIALVLAVGMIAGLGAPYLVQAGVPLWVVLLLVLVVLAVPIVAVTRSDRRR